MIELPSTIVWHTFEVEWLLAVNYNSWKLQKTDRNNTLLRWFMDWRKFVNFDAHATGEPNKVPFQCHLQFGNQSQAAGNVIQYRVFSSSVSIVKKTRTTQLMSDLNHQPTQQLGMFSRNCCFASVTNWNT